MGKFVKRGGINLKSTGSVRRIDDLGRIVIPANIREQLNINMDDALEISIDGESIILTKYGVEKD